VFISKTLGYKRHLRSLDRAVEMLNGNPLHTRSRTLFKVEELVGKMAAVTSCHPSGWPANSGKTASRNARGIIHLRSLQCVPRIAPLVTRLLKNRSSKRPAGFNRPFLLPLGGP
jgi:hypothetical protein